MNEDEYIQPPPAPPVSRDSEMPPVRFGILAGIGVTLFAMMGAVTASVVLNLKQSSPYYQILLGVSLLCLMLLPTLYIARTQSLPLRELFRLRAPSSPLVFLAVIIGVITLSTVLQAYTIAQEIFLIPPELKSRYLELTSKTQESVIALVRTSSIVGLLTALFSIALAPALSEELLFRGLVQRSFERRMRPLAAIALAGVMFGSVHLQPQNAVALIALGIFFGYVTLVSNSIYPAMVGHFMFNAQTIIAIYFTGEAALDTVTRHTVDNLLELLPLAIPALLVFIGVIVWLRGQRLIAEQKALTLNSSLPDNTSE